VSERRVTVLVLSLAATIGSLAARLQQHVMPFFSRTLSFEPVKR